MERSDSNKRTAFSSARCVCSTKSASGRNLFRHGDQPAFLTGIQDNSFSGCRGLGRRKRDDAVMFAVDHGDTVLAVRRISTMRYMFVKVPTANLSFTP